MKDYNKPPTDEFKMLTNANFNDFNTWFTLQKSVMNDYWFDHSEYFEFTKSELDHLFHKLYYCWLMMGNDIYNGKFLDQEKSE